MINTATAAMRPFVESPASCQPTKVASASRSTAGTNTPAMRSASRCTGAFALWASSTSRTMCAYAVSLPTAVARTVNTPFVFRVAPVTRSPTCLSTGIDSPVSIDSSTAEDPATTSPSTATFSPGRTTITSPTRSAVTGTVRS